MMRSGPRVWVCAITCALSMAACAEVGLAPDVPAAIELTALPSPSVVLGDTLRNVAGVVTPVQAVVRNVGGDIIADAKIRYLYADYARDSALAVDSMSGIVRALRVSKASTGDGRLAARVSTSLQVLKSLVITTRPDSVHREQLSLALFTTTLPDTGRAAATTNTSASMAVVVRHLDSLGVKGVNAWPVRFELLSPANATNDTTKSVWLVDDQGRASVLDTSDAAGIAGRKVRIRAAQFPAVGVTDSVIVRAIVSYKGISLKGAPVRLALPVKRGS